MSTHTEGPWFIRHCDDEHHMCMTVISTKDRGPYNDSQFDGEGDTVAIVYHQLPPFVCGGFDIDDCDEREANARLIAASPELLEACRIALPYLGDVLIADHPDYTAVYSAIAKAAGEQR